MRKIFILIVIIGFLAVIPVNVHAQTGCNLNIELINQDPFPAIPGESADVVFQVNGIQNPVCNKITFEIIEEFPFTLEPETDSKTTIQGGTFTEDFKSFAILPYTIIVDENALDGKSPLEIRLGSEVLEVHDFDIEIEDVRTDFEIFIKDYVEQTSTLTFEILNIGENDAEAVTIEIPKQEVIAVKGTNKNIIGSLDSNEDTTFDFEAIPEEGKIEMVVFYTDKINVRRSIEKTVSFDPSYFTDRNRDETKLSTSFYLLILLIVIIIIVWIWKWRKKKKLHHKRHHMAHHKS